MNKVLQFVKDLKALYISEHGNISYDYPTDNFGSAVEMWAANVSNHRYAEIVKYMYVNRLPNTNLYLFKYRNYNAIFGEIPPEEFWDFAGGIFTHCRSVTIDVEKEEIILESFDKFFNINERPETKLSEVVKRLKNAKVIEITNKMDGSMQVARWYNGRLYLTGSSAIDRAVSFRVEHGYKWLEQHPNYIEMFQKHPNISFIFEYIMGDDPHVITYRKDEYGLYLTGGRNMETREMLHYAELKNIADEFDILITEQEHITFDEMLAARDKFRCDEKEGWVVNIDGWRVKFKCDDFVAMHSVVSGCVFGSARLGNAVMKAFQTNTFDDFFAKVAENKKEAVTKTMDYIRNYIKEQDTETRQMLERMKAECGNPDDVKTFMLYVNQNCSKKICGRVCNMYRGRQNQYLKGLKWSDIYANAIPDSEDSED